jgi:hypothetical protein
MKGSLSVIVQLSSVCSLTSFAVHAEEERKLAHTETNVRNFFRSYRQRKQMDHHLDEATITEVSEEDEEFDEELSHTAPAHSSLDEVSDEMNKVSMDAHTEQTHTHTHTPIHMQPLPSPLVYMRTRLDLRFAALTGFLCSCVRANAMVARGWKRQADHGAAYRAASVGSL